METVPVTLVACAAGADAGAPSLAFVDDESEELLQPASATAATVISDHTTLRMEETSGLDRFEREPCDATAPP
jgi:hypothetical protein